MPLNPPAPQEAQLNDAPSVRPTTLLASQRTEGLSAFLPAKGQPLHSSALRELVPCTTPPSHLRPVNKSAQYIANVLTIFFHLIAAEVNTSHCPYPREPSATLTRACTWINQRTDILVL
jgi:hypothetical protein